ncbi:MAG: GNAT family N-acetyltransferase [Bacteroidetes bacterium]|nr:GNAT family N-acetyltransferase [Bacteroidota bacterium]MCY4234498.1 GNAT family N-acetyltransferase [Bacteroidota bacterium]
MSKPQPVDSSHSFEIKEGLEGLSPIIIRMLYRRAPLHRPVSDPERLWTMFEKASLVVTVWKGARLVGIARVLTDEVLCSYLCDLAIEPDVQGLGIGKRLMKYVQDRCEGTELVLRSSLSRFHRRSGLEPINDFWAIKPESS